jgi:deazaflavin-dependent oxidoreductase (nitroreductase family)
MPPRIDPTNYDEEVFQSIRHSTRSHDSERLSPLGSTRWYYNFISRLEENLSIIDPAVEQKLQQVFKYFNRGMLLIWRLGLGQWLNAWPKVGGRILVVTHTGRVTGLTRRTPLNYAIVDGDIYITAGFGSRSDWYRNLKANSQVQVWLPQGWWSGVAQEVTDPVQRLSLLRQVLIGSGIVAPMFGIHPQTMTDEELDQVTHTYKLLRIRRLQACTGPGGPGELAWVWPLATLILLPLALRRRKSR